MRRSLVQTRSSARDDKRRIEANDVRELCEVQVEACVFSVSHRSHADLTVLFVGAPGNLRFAGQVHGAAIRLIGRGLPYRHLRFVAFTPLRVSGRSTSTLVKLIWFRWPRLLDQHLRLQG